VYERASSVVLEPERYRDTLAFMFESRYVIVPTRHALQLPTLQKDYTRCWDGIEAKFHG
jgi:homogentisate 1,2-dioxygenase